MSHSSSPEGRIWMYCNVSPTWMRPSLGIVCFLIHWSSLIHVYIYISPVYTQWIKSTFCGFLWWCSYDWWLKNHAYHPPKNQNNDRNDRCAQRLLDLFAFQILLLTHLCKLQVALSRLGCSDMFRIKCDWFSTAGYTKTHRGVSSSPQISGVYNMISPTKPWE